MRKRDLVSLSIQTELGKVSFLEHIDHVNDLLPKKIPVSPDMNGGLLAFSLHNLVQLKTQLRFSDRVITPVVNAFRIDCDEFILHRRRRLSFGGRLLGQIDPVVLLDNRGGDHENNQKRKSQINQWRHIQIRYDRQFLRSFEILRHLPVAKSVPRWNRLNQAFFSSSILSDKLLAKFSSFVMADRVVPKRPL